MQSPPISIPVGSEIPTLEASSKGIYDIELEHDLVDANARIARDNRALLDRHGITAIDIMGAIGSGKTTLIVKLTEKLKGWVNVAVFNGDATTTNDAEALAQQDVPVVQIATVNACHLDANLVSKALNKIDLLRTGLIFIENVGNLICPADYPTGSKARVVVVSVTEGPYTVKKHPHMFLGAQIVVINKTDMARAMDVSIEGLMQDVQKLKPDIKVIPVSCKTGAGIVELASALLDV
jgi:hydrogenase nickel incorporation protein HypB